MEVMGREWRNRSSHTGTMTRKNIRDKWMERRFGIEI